MLQFALVLEFPTLCSTVHGTPIGVFLSREGREESALQREAVSPVSSASPEAAPPGQLHLLLQPPGQVTAPSYRWPHSHIGIYIFIFSCKGQLGPLGWSTASLLAV